MKRYSKRQSNLRNYYYTKDVKLTKVVTIYQH